MIFKTPRWNLDRRDFSAAASDREVVITYDQLLPFMPKAWIAANISRQFPDLAQEFAARRANSPTHRNISFEEWYNSAINCYAYALGDRSAILRRVCGSTNIGAIAGRGRLLGSHDMTADRLRQLAQGDKLRATGDEIIWEEDARPIALFLSKKPGAVSPKVGDFHWLRHDTIFGDASMTLWTHTIDETGPRIVTDENGLPIRDPRKMVFPAPDGYQYEFDGFYNVPLDHSVDVDVALNIYERHKILLPAERKLLANDNKGKGLRLPIRQYG